MAQIDRAANAMSMTLNKEDGLGLDGLDGTVQSPGCQTAGWPLSGIGETCREEESPGSTGTRCRVTPGGGDPRESATESKPPARGRQG